MKWLISIILAGVLFGPLYAQAGPDKDRFVRKAHSCHMAFSDAAGYREVKVDTSLNIRYDYALADPQGSFEIRYKINPAAGGLARPDADAKKQDALYKSNLMAICFDITRTQKMSYQPFPREYMKSAVNADMGGRALLQGGSTFSKGFQHVYMLTFYKTNIGQIFVFYLFNGQDTAALGKVVKETGTQLKFFPTAATAPGASAPGKRSPAEEDRLGKFYIDSLHATRLQADSLVAINERYAAWGQQVKTDASMEKKDKISALQALVRQRDAMYRKILSPAQYEAWKKMKKARR